MNIRKTTDDTTATSNYVLGLSGLDTSSMLTAMMASYKKPIAAASQKQQLVVWKQERYREIIKAAQDFRAKYFDYKTPGTNLLAEGTFKKYTVQNAGEQYVKITTTTGSKPKSGTVEILSMPTMATAWGADVTKAMQGSANPSYTSLGGKSFNINMDGVVRTVTLPSTVTGVADVQAAVDTMFGTGRISVSEASAGGPLVFSTDGSSARQVTIYETATGGTTLSDLGFGTGANTSTRLSTSYTLDKLSGLTNNALTFKTLDADGNTLNPPVVSFTINGQEFSFSKQTSLQTVIDTVNADTTANVTLAYDNATDTFTLKADVGGPAGTLTYSDSADSSFLAAIGLGTHVFSATDTNMKGGIPATTAVADLNAAIAAGTAFSFDVTVDGVKNTITLDGYPSSGTAYSSPADVLAHIQNQVNTLYPSAGITASLDSADSWRLNVDVAYSASPPSAKSIVVSLPSSQSSGLDADTAAQLFADLGLSALPQAYTEGDFGAVVIDGQYIAVDHTKFEYDGVTYELLKETPAGDPVTYGITADADAIVEVLKGFVEAYNAVLTMINAALSEERDTDYAPLTDEQREDMEDTEIEKWEAKAKTGIMRGETDLISFQSKFRLSIFDSIYTSSGSGDSLALTRTNYALSVIGITTTRWEDMGMIELDETTLRMAIEEDIDKVAKLFAKAADTYTADATKSDAWNAAREKEVAQKTRGVAYRLMDMLDEYIATTRNSAGNKGKLIERAGVENDLSATTSALSVLIARYDTQINNLWDRYDRVEEQKIKILSTLETYVSNASAQSSWLAGQTSS